MTMSYQPNDHRDLRLDENKGALRSLYGWGLQANQKMSATTFYGKLQFALSPSKRAPR